MPLNSVLQGLKALLDGITIPGEAGVLEAFITPVDPRDDLPPAIYIWVARGDEKRQSVPRAKVVASPPSFSGHKELMHRCEAYVTWFGETSDPRADTSFPSVVDTVMMVLRTSTNPIEVLDPMTGFSSQLVDIGENMTYILAPVRSTADQRIIRYDAQITINVLEQFQS